MMWKSRLLLSLLLVCAMQLGASVVKPVDVATQVDQADLIFVGKVIGTQSVASKDGSFAYTYVTFDVEETLKGAASGRTLTLRVAGGQVGQWIYEISGGPKFNVGGRHLLFVAGNDRYLVPFAGGPQGKLDLVAHPVTQELVITDDGGRALDGIREKAWVRGGMKLDRNGQLRQPKAAAAVISEQGVKIELDARDAAPQFVDNAAPAAKVLGELRSLIKARSFAAGFRRGATVESASPANVPVN